MFNIVRPLQKVKTAKPMASFSPLPPLHINCRKSTQANSQALFQILYESYHKLNNKQRRTKSDTMRLSGSWLAHSWAKGFLPLTTQNEIQNQQNCKLLYITDLWKCYPRAANMYVKYAYLLYFFWGQYNVTFFLIGCYQSKIVPFFWILSALLTLTLFYPPIYKLKS